MIAVSQARQDFKAGLGQDANPYDREKQPVEFFDYAWEMHRLWAEEARDEILLSKQTSSGGPL